ncbi:pyroglutamyl-peptidase I, partial [uncultured Dubosiella sp.]
MKILITGFNPFGGESTNPAFEAVKLLPETIKEAQIIKLEIPTEFKRAGKVLQDGIETNKPDVVVCIGQAGGRSAITPEKVAINLMDGRIPDNAGYQPVDTPVREDGPTAYFTSLPVKAMVETIREAGIPAFLSYSAGTYVCNFLMYELLYLIDHHYPNIKGGFIHVPYMSQQVVNKPNGTPSMDLKTIARGLEKAVEAIVEHDEDIA